MATTAFGAWLKEEMAKRDICVAHLAHDIGITPQAINNHLAGRVQPVDNTLMMYSQYFKVPYSTLRRMIVRTSRPITVRHTRSTAFGEWLFGMMDERDLSVRQLAAELDFTETTVRQHLTSVFVPSLRAVKKYCKYFGVQDYWDVYELALHDKPIHR